MALAAIIHTFDVELAENDWNVHESRAPCVAPSLGVRKASGRASDSVVPAGAVRDEEQVRLIHHNAATCVAAHTGDQAERAGQPRLGPRVVASIRIGYRRVRRALARMDVRGTVLAALVPGETPEQVREELETIVRATGDDASVECFFDRPPLVSAAENRVATCLATR